MRCICPKESLGKSRMWRSCHENYEVSTEGDVRNKKTGRILKGGVCKNGYKKVCLGFGNCVYVHWLVTEAFLPAPTNVCVRDHIDRNKTNNHASNLRWVSHSENSYNQTLQVKSKSHKSDANHHIIQTKGGFIVRFCKRDLTHQSYHDTLEQAITARDGVIKTFYEKGEPLM